MKTWKDISLYTFQQIERINADASMSDENKALFGACEVFGITEYELDNTAPRKALKILKNIELLFKGQPQGKAANRIGKYILNYDPATMTLGQYVELSFFLKMEVHGAHLALASISRRRFRKYTTDGHRERADYFLYQPIEIVQGSLQLFIAQFKSFNEEYRELFGLDKEVYDIDVQGDQFNKRYGWIYSAARVAEYERITQDQAFGIPIRQALNDLSFLKERDRYEAEQQKKMMENIKTQPNGR